MQQLPTQAHRFYWMFIRPRWRTAAVMCFSEMFWGTTLIAFPWCVKHLVEFLIREQRGQLLPSDYLLGMPWPLLVFVAFWLFMEFVIRTAGWLRTVFRPNLAAAIRSHVFDYVQDHAFGYFINQFAGNLANKISDLSSCAEQLLEVVLYNYIPSFVVLSLTFVVFWSTSHWFAGITMLWALLHALISIIFLPSCHRLFTQHADTQSQLSGRIVDSLSNFINVKLFARHEYEENHLAELQSTEVQQNIRALRQLEWMRTLLGLNIAVFIISMVVMLMRGWREGWVTPGDFTLVSMLTLQVIGQLYFVTLSTTLFISQLSKVRAALKVLARRHDMQDMPDAKPLEVSAGKIEFKSVCFNYDKKSGGLFDQFDVCIQPGEKVGLVGLSGAGKSSFVNLLLRLYDVEAGGILIDGQSIAKVTRDSLRQQIAMIPQDPSLFHRSLRENICYGDLQATDQQIDAAARAAHCDEFISQLEEGYDTLVGERGIKLSGGQRQRIAIARAFLKNAPILVLDEATSALDSITEKQIHASLVRLMAERTTIVIAHRLSTLREMDRLLVFERGRIIESGSFDDLSAANGEFARMWNHQSVF